MVNFRQQLFQEFATKGILASVEAFQTKYQPKRKAASMLRASRMKLARLASTKTTLNLKSALRFLRRS